jgi:hypothetical protein
MALKGGTADYLDLGDWNATCYECGRKKKASYLRKHWQGYYVCPEHWEPRQPQDFVRSVPDNMTVPWAQPQEDVFINPLCNLEGQSAVPDMAMPNCAIPGKYFSGLVPPPIGPSNSAIAGIAVADLAIAGVS